MRTTLATTHDTQENMMVEIFTENEESSNEEKSETEDEDDDDPYGRERIWMEHIRKRERESRRKEQTDTKNKEDTPCCEQTDIDNEVEETPSEKETYIKQENKSPSRKKTYINQEKETPYIKKTNLKHQKATASRVQIDTEVEDETLSREQTEEFSSGYEDQDTPRTKKTNLNHQKETTSREHIDTENEEKNTSSREQTEAFSSGYEDQGTPYVKQTYIRQEKETPSKEQTYTENEGAGTLYSEQTKETCTGIEGEDTPHEEEIDTDTENKSDHTTVPRFSKYHYTSDLIMASERLKKACFSKHRRSTHDIPDVARGGTKNAIPVLDIAALMLENARRMSKTKKSQDPDSAANIMGYPAGMKVDPAAKSQKKHWRKPARKEEASQGDEAEELENTRAGQEEAGGKGHAGSQEEAGQVGESSCAGEGTGEVGGDIYGEEGMEEYFTEIGRTGELWTTIFDLAARSTPAFRSELRTLFARESDGRDLKLGARILQEGRMRYSDWRKQRKAKRSAPALAPTTADSPISRVHRSGKRQKLNNTH